MKPRRKARTIFGLVLGIGMLVSACSMLQHGAAATPNTSTPTTQDSVYISTLNEYGIPYSSSAAAIATAHAVCTELSQGATGTQLMGVIVQNSSYTDVQAGAIVGASTGSYCSQYKAISQQ